MTERFANPAAADTTESKAETSRSPAETLQEKQKKPVRPKEIGGRDGPDPTRFGDWEKNGRCIDF